MVIGPVVEIDLTEVVKSLKRIERERKKESKLQCKNYYSLHREEVKERNRVNRLNLESYRKKYKGVYDNLIII